MQTETPIRGYDDTSTQWETKPASAASQPQCPLFINTMTSQTRSLAGIHNTILNLK